MASARFIANLQSGETPEETANRAIQELVRIVDQLNQANLPIVVGPGQSLPEGMLPGQPVIDWRTGTSTTKVWNGNALI